MGTKKGCLDVNKICSGVNKGCLEEIKGCLVVHDKFYMCMRAGWGRMTVVRGRIRAVWGRSRVAFG